MNTITAMEILAERYGFDRSQIDKMDYHVRKSLAAFARRQRLLEQKRLGLCHDPLDTPEVQE